MAQNEKVPRLPWWPAPADRAPVREPLSRGQIVAAAIRVADAEGGAALSMRRLAQELGAGTTSLYRHVSNKDELLDLALDQVLGEVRADDDPAKSWQDRAGALIRAFRDVLRRHPGIAPLIDTRVTRGPQALALGDRLLGILRAAGFAGIELGLAYQILLRWGSAFGAIDARETGRPLAEGHSGVQQEALIDEMLAGLPRDVYPNIVITFDYAHELTSDAQFESGLRVILTGLAGELAAGGLEG